MLISPDRIPVAGPSITDREPELVAEAARTAWYGNAGAYNARFESMMADYVGVKHAISLPHATSGLHLILAAGGIGPGDEVIVPDTTWIASVAPVVHLGATPVVVAITTDTWCLDPVAVEAAIGPRTRAIIGVDLYGSMCDWAALRAIADRHGLLLVEDAAEALGSTLGGRRAGAFGDGAVFSFHGSKTVATGEGGMLVTDSDELAARIEVLRDHGRSPGDQFFRNREFAFKYKMNAVTAALGCAQMERIDQLIEHKRAIFGWYRDRLGDLAGVTLNAEPVGVENSYWMVTAVPDPSYGMDKFDLMARFAERNVDTRPFFTPLSELGVFSDRPESTRFVVPGSPDASIAARGVNLPSGYNMDEETTDLVCRILTEILSRKAGVA